MRAAQHDPPEALGPGSADESGLVTYGQVATAPPPATRLPAEPPESLGPGSETAGGGLAYGVPGVTPGPMPGPTPAEREAEAALRDHLVASCACTAIPGAVIMQLAELASRARVIPAEGIGCPRCRAIPQGMVRQLVAALETGGER